MEGGLINEKLLFYIFCYITLLRFWLACLNTKSSVSGSWLHYSVVSLYHGIVLAL